MSSILGQGPDGRSRTEAAAAHRTHTVALRLVVAAIVATSIAGVWLSFTMLSAFADYWDYLLALAGVPLLGGAAWYGIAWISRTTHRQALTIARLGAMAHGIWAALPAAFLILLPLLSQFLGCSGLALAVLITLLAFPLGALSVTFEMAGRIIDLLPRGDAVERG